MHTVRSNFSRFHTFPLSNREMEQPTGLPHCGSQSRKHSEMQLEPRLDGKGRTDWVRNIFTLVHSDLHQKKKLQKNERHQVKALIKKLQISKPAAKTCWQRRCLPWPASLVLPLPQGAQAIGLVRGRTVGAAPRHTPRGGES